MSLLDKLNSAKEKLKPTTTVVMLEDGREVEETRSLDGSFQKVAEDDESMVSNRRRKKVDRMRRMGFVVDLKPDLQMAECCSSVYLGSQDAAANLEGLQTAGITHIVNCATGVTDYFPTKFRYLHLETLDLPSEKIIDHFDVVHDFISRSISYGGRVFVHCNAGISRASTLVLSYMMRAHTYTLDAALQHVRSVRPAVRPNDGFMQQLLIFEDKLKIAT